MADRPRSRPRLLAVLGKSAFGVAVFSITVGAYAFLSDDVLRLYRPLPEGGVAADGCTVWFVGSSSIHKWTTLRHDMKYWDARNRGVNGALIPELEHRFTLDRDAGRPAAVVLYAGDNDIAKNHSAAHSAAQVMSLIDTVRARMGQTPVFVIGLKPSPTRWALRAEQLRYDALMRQATAARPQLRTIDAADALLVNGVPGPFYVEDGVHLNGIGYTRWGARIRRVFEAEMPAATVARCARRPAN